eukprot:snap_masked-scaffold_1-processed-gene-21.18-mRNA-1 protein AED:1.00 eAED:1.00 QI:0/0/0/0/1/1/2/0/69
MKRASKLKSIPIEDFAPLERILNLATQKYNSYSISPILRDGKIFVCILPLYRNRYLLNYNGCAGVLKKG